MIASPKLMPSLIKHVGTPMSSIVSLQDKLKMERRLEVAKKIDQVKLGKGKGFALGKAPGGAADKLAARKLANAAKAAGEEESKGGEAKNKDAPL